MFNTLLKKLIKAAGGRVKMMMAIIGLSVATLLILFSVQLQANYYDLLNAKNNQDSITNFLVINKVLNNETIGNTGITTDNVADFKKQNFVQEVSIITPSRFKASLQSNSERFPFYTDISFESVPSSFIDVNTANWNWTEDADFVPIIAPNMFLDFYNFQFAFSQNMPQLTPDIVKMIVFNVNVQTAIGNKQYKGRIVGFSNRITSLLVPQEFMTWGNQFTSGKAAQPSRLIIKTKDPGNPVLVNYLEKNGYTTDADKTRFSKYRKIVNTVVSISWITGAIMLSFALLIFTLFIQLTVTACKNEIALLITLGTAPKQLEKFLMKQFFPANIIIIFICTLVITILQFFTSQWLQKLNMFVSNYISIYTIIVALVLLCVLWIVNKFTVRKYVYKQP
ncbi:MAG: hypothetical protein NTZ59_15100 [Bacteroidetes bacterium]|nr:hypothetical protein [Bacteroidota bacterium]